MTFFLLHLHMYNLTLDTVFSDIHFFWQNHIKNFTSYLLSEHFCKPLVRMREECLFFLAKSIFSNEFLEIPGRNTFNLH